LTAFVRDDAGGVAAAAVALSLFVVAAIGVGAAVPSASVSFLAASTGNVGGGPACGGMFSAAPGCDAASLSAVASAKAEAALAAKEEAGARDARRRPPSSGTALRSSSPRDFSAGWTLNA
jgi:hypothetical protein